LPAALLLLDRKRLPSQGPAVALGSRILAARAEEAVLRKAPWTLLLVLVLLLLAAPRIASVGFDYNLLRLQDPRLESVQTELRLIQEGGNTVLFAVALADNIEHARELKARFEALPAVSHVDTVSDLFPEVTPGKLAALRRLRELVADVHIPNPDDAPAGRRFHRAGAVLSGSTGRSSPPRVRAGA
jgi:hypothetical protein